MGPLVMRRSLLLLLWACGSPDALSLRFSDAPPEAYAAAESAVAEWNEACGAGVTLTRQDGDVPIQMQPAGSMGAVSGYTHWHTPWPGGRHEPTHINIDERYAMEREVYAHEIGHALGYEHRDYGIMLPGAPLDTHVTLSDCEERTGNE